MTDSVNATVTQRDIVNGLRDLGIQHGDGLLVHSSLSKFGHVVNGADAVIDALLEAVGESGNVLVPTLTGTRNDGPDAPPVFDVRTTPCWTGRIPSVFMQRSEALRSLHPTHSVAGIGTAVPALLAGHQECITPCGPTSPYYRLAEEGGFILLLGVGQESNTTLHTAEELAQVPYHMQAETTDTVVIDHDGIEHVRRLGLHDWGTPRNFPRIDEELVSRGHMRMGQVGGATVRLIRSMAMLDWLVPILTKDPMYLVQTGSQG